MAQNTSNGNGEFLELQQDYLSGLNNNWQLGKMASIVFHTADR